MACVGVLSTPGCAGRARATRVIIKVLEEFPGLGGGDRSSMTSRSSKEGGEGMAQDLTLSVEGMTCAGCEDNVAFALSALPGVEEASADHEANTVDITFDPATTTAGDIRKAIEDIGYLVTD